MMTRKHVFRFLVAVAVAILLLVVACVVVLRSGAFHRFVLREVAEKASQSTGARVEIGDFRFRWAGLRLDFYHIVLHGSEPADKPPLLQIAHLIAGVKIVSLWRPEFSLYELVIDRPSVHMSVEQNGRSNLPPTPPKPPGSRPTNIFDLAIGRCALNQGELDYNDRQIPLDAEVHDLQAHVSFDAGRTEYAGTLGYRDGRVQFGAFNPVQHDLQVHFGATPSGLVLDSVVLNAGASSFSAQGHLQDYSNPSIDGAYQSALSTTELARIVKVTSIPEGRMDLRGTLHYQNHSDRPFLDNLVTSGVLSSPALGINLPQARADVRSLSGEYRLSGGTLEVRNARADVLGGRINGNLTLIDLTGRRMGRLTAALSDISLAAASVASNTQPLERAAISGNLNGNLEGFWEGSGQNLKLQADATIAASAPVGPPNAAAGNAIPLHGSVHAAYDAPTGTITLRDTELATPHLTLKLNGSTGKRSSLGIQAQSDDLRELDQLMLVARHATATRTHPSAAPAEPLGIEGSATFTGQLQGTMSNLQLTGRLRGSNLQFRNTNLAELQVNVALSPSDASLSQGEFRIRDGGQARFDANVGLKNWTYSPQNAVRVDLSLAKIPAGTLMQVANVHYPVSGILGARLTAHGSQANVMGEGSLTLTQATAWGQAFQRVNLQFQGAGDTIHSTLQVLTSAGSVSGTLTYGIHNESYDAQLTIPDLQIERLEAVQAKRVQVSGILTASLEGRGTLKDPELTATIQTPKLLIGRQALDGLALHADIAHQQATFNLNSAAQGARIQIQGAVTLNADYPGKATVDVRNIQLSPWLDAFLPKAPPELRGQAELHGSVNGPLKHWHQLEAQLEIPTLNLSYHSLQIGNASPLRATYHDGVATLDKCELKGTDTDLHLQATVPFEHAREVQAAATGTVGLHLIQLFYPDWHSSGQLRLDVSAAGTTPHPSVSGTVRLEDATLESAEAPLGVESVNAVLGVKNGRVDVQSFTGALGGGTFSVQGFATYQPAVQFSLALNAKTVRLRYPIGTRSILDSKLILTGSESSALLSGSVLVDRLSLTREFDLSTFADQFTGESAPAPTASFADNVKLDISLKTASEMALASTKLSVQGTANLMVRGTAAEPVILGRSDITGGEIFFNGNRYLVQSGVIQFVNPVQTEPLVNVVVTTTIDQFNLTMNFVGPIDRLRTTYTSDPPLAPVDIINLLATGQTTEAASTTSTNPESVIAGQLTSQLSSRVEKLAGITSLTIDPQVGGAQANGGGRLAIQQRVTKNLYFTFSTDLTTSTGQIVQVEYQVTKRFAVNTIRDQNGGYSVQIRVHKNF